MGTIVEMYFDEEKKAYWALAAVPDYDIEDVRAMSKAADIKLAEENGERTHRTPQELMDSIDQHTPICEDEEHPILVHSKPSDFWEPNHPEMADRLKYCSMLTKEGRELLQKQPLFDWKQLLTLFK